MRALPGPGGSGGQAEIPNRDFSDSDFPEDEDGSFWRVAEAPLQGRKVETRVAGSRTFGARQGRKIKGSAPRVFLARTEF